MMMQQEQQTQTQTWTTERVELLKQLWQEGLSASVIAGRLGAASRATPSSARSTASGCRGAPRRPAPRPRGPAARASPVTRPVKAVRPVVVSPAAADVPTSGANALKPQVCQERVVEPDPDPIRLVDIPKGERTNLLMLSEKTCRWPIGEPGTEDFFFCGMSPRESTPYCEYHARLAYQPLHARNRQRRA
jgi:GcrA cell cycle regulator